MLRRDAKIELLKGAPLFAHCSKNELGNIGLVADEIDMPAGKVLTTEGDPGREFFVLIEGTAEVRRKGRKVNVMGAGDFFGEMGLIENAPRNASVTASSPLTAVVMTGSAFRQIDRELPEVAKQIRKAIDERCRHLAPVE